MLVFIYVLFGPQEKLLRPLLMPVYFIIEYRIELGGHVIVTLITALFESKLNYTEIRIFTQYRINLFPKALGFFSFSNET
jgi:hypothetical protein